MFNLLPISLLGSGEVFKLGQKWTFESDCSKFVFKASVQFVCYLEVFSSLKESFGIISDLSESERNVLRYVKRNKIRGPHAETSNKKRPVSKKKIRKTGFSVQ